MTRTKNRKLPAHIPGTIRQWRRKKRAEWRAVLKAFSAFRLGCAYTPACDRDSEVQRIQQMLDEVSQALSPAKWGK